MTFGGRNSENKQTYSENNNGNDNNNKKWQKVGSWREKRPKGRALKAHHSPENWGKVSECLFDVTHVPWKMWTLLPLTVKCTAEINSDLHTLFTKSFAVCAENNREPSVLNALGHLFVLWQFRKCNEPGDKRGGREDVRMRGWELNTLTCPPLLAIEPPTLHFLSWGFFCYWLETEACCSIGFDHDDAEGDPQHLCLLRKLIVIFHTRLLRRHTHGDIYRCTFHTHLLLNLTADLRLAFRLL